MTMWRKVKDKVWPRMAGEDIRGQVLRLALPATAEQMLAMMVGIVLLQSLRQRASAAARRDTLPCPSVAQKG